MKTLKFLYKAKAELLEAQEVTNNIIVSLSTKKKSDAADKIIHTQKEIFDRISNILNLISGLENTTMQAKRELLDQQDLLKKYYNYSPPRRTNYKEAIEDKATLALNEIWKSMSTPDATQYKLMVTRILPARINKQPANGYLKTFYLPITIPDIIEQVRDDFGAGEYRINIIDEHGKNIKAKHFTVATGESRLGNEWEENAKLRQELETITSETP